MKKFYEAPGFEIITASTLDVITLSLSEIDYKADEFNTEIGDIEI